jgi:hypothetical protein
MDKIEARSLLDTEIARLRPMTYAELRKYFDEEHREVTGPSGKEYQVETLAVWDHKPEGDLRIFVSIDDGGLRAIVPMTDGFILRPDGSFVGE